MATSCPIPSLLLCGSDAVNLPSSKGTSGQFITSNGTDWINTTVTLGTAAAQNVGFFAQVANALSDVNATNAKSNLGLATVASTGVYSDLTGRPDLTTYAPLASPALTGNPTAPTQTAGNNTTRIATTAFVTTAISTAVSGLFHFAGTWNATTNSPTLTSGSGVDGAIYRVTVAGTTSLDGIAVWNIGDNAVFSSANGVWTKWEGQATEVISVAGRVGAVVLANTDISGLGTASTVNTGTSGATIPFLNGTNTWSAAQTLSSLATASSGIQFVGSGGVLQTGSAANIIRQVNSTTAQEFQVFGTWTNDSNYERFVVRSAAGNYTIGTEKAGTGSSRGLIIETAGTAAITIDTSQGATFAGTVTMNALAISTANPTGGAAITNGVEMQSATQMYVNVAGTTAVKITATTLRANGGTLYIGGSGAESTLRGSLNVLSMGDVDSASPSAQTLKVQNATGSGNIPAVVTTIQGCLAVGTNVTPSGDIVFKTTANVAASGVQNTGVAALTLAGGTQVVTTASNLVCGNALQVLGGVIQTNNNSRLVSGVNGNWTMQNNGGSGFTSLTFGGTQITTAFNVAIQVAPIPITQTNTASGNLTYQVGQSTGNVGSGSHIFQVSPAGTAGSTQNTLVTALTIDSTKLATFAGAIAVTGHATLEGVTSTGATGTGKLVYDTSPTLVTPLLGTPTSGNLANCTALPGSALTSSTLGSGVGFSATSYSKGTVSSGTYTPAASDGNFQYATNNGAHTLAPPSTVCTIVVEYLNGASAGTITTSGFTKVSGDSLTTTNTSKFLCYITKTQNYSSLNVLALQ